jgi:hypothetical protein
MQGDSRSYVAHPNVYGIVVEKDAGNAHDMNGLRERAGKPALPVWFVFFDEHPRQIVGKTAARNAATLVQQYASMHVTYSPGGEYVDAIDELVPTDRRATNIQIPVTTGIAFEKNGRVREAQNVSVQNGTRRAQ